MNFCSSGFLLDELIINRSKFTRVFAFQAPDAFRGVRALRNPDFNRAIPEAFITLRAFLLIDYHTEKTDFIEDTEDSSKRTCGPTKRTFAHNHQS